MLDTLSPASPPLPPSLCRTRACFHRSVDTATGRRRAGRHGVRPVRRGEPHGGHDRGTLHGLLPFFSVQQGRGGRGRRLGPGASVALLRRRVCRGDLFVFTPCHYCVCLLLFGVSILLLLLILSPPLNIECRVSFLYVSCFLCIGDVKYIAVLRTSIECRKCFHRLERGGGGLPPHAARRTGTIQRVFFCFFLLTRT